MRLRTLIGEGHEKTPQYSHRELGGFFFGPGRRLPERVYDTAACNFRKGLVYFVLLVRHLSAPERVTV